MACHLVSFVLTVIAINLIVVNGDLKDQLRKRLASSRLEDLEGLRESLPELLNQGLEYGKNTYSTNALLFSNAIETEFEDEVQYREGQASLKHMFTMFDAELDQFETEGADEFKIVRMFEKLKELLVSINVEMKQVITGGKQDEIEKALKKNFKKVEQFFQNVIDRFRTLVDQEIKSVKELLKN